MLDMLNSSCVGNNGKLETIVADPTVKKSKHRRGKKRVRPEPYFTTCNEVADEYNTLPSTSHDDSTSGFQLPRRRVEKGNDVRPRYSPKAPRNYTQFLINDQDDSKVDVNSNIDLDSFLQTQFESDFKQARAAELAQKSKQELTELIHQLENKKTELKEVYHNCQTCNNVDNTDSHSEHNSSFSDNDSDDSFSSHSEDHLDANSLLLHQQLLALQHANAQLQEENQRLVNNRS